MITATHHPNYGRSAFTLLEVVLALAILAGAVAMLGELISYASRNAADAQAETRAQLLASTLMDEMVAGVSEPAQQSRQPLEVDDVVPWVYSVNFERTEVAGLTSVEVLVEQDLEKQFHPVKYRLVRWLPKVPIESAEEDSESTTASEATEGDDG